MGLYVDCSLNGLTALTTDERRSDSNLLQLYKFSSRSSSSTRCDSSSNTTRAGVMSVPDHNRVINEFSMRERKFYSEEFFSTRIIQGDRKIMPTFNKMLSTLQYC